MVFLDTCSSINAGTDSAKSDNTSLLRKLKDNSPIVFNSCRENENSQERNEYRHGLFTNFIMTGMFRDADRSNDGKVTIGELFTYVHESVSLLTQGKQNPNLIAEGLRDFEIAEVTEE
jgi:hypothetical protein